MGNGAKQFFLLGRKPSSCSQEGEKTPYRINLLKQLSYIGEGSDKLVSKVKMEKNAIQKIEGMMVYMEFEKI